MKTSPPKTRPQIEALIGALAAATIQRQALTAKMDAQLANIRTLYEPDLALLADRLDDLTQAAHLWAQANPEEFAKRKSIEFTQGTLGFRTCPPKLKPLSKWTWAKILEQMQRIASWNHYLRTLQEVDKEAILADRAILAPSTLASAGLRIVQDEEFYIDPKLTPVETRLSNNQ